MPREKKEKPKKPPCPGGKSYNRRRDSHSLGTVENIVCFRCGARMGCGVCCEPLIDLICLVCHDWAARQALQRHGTMVPASKREDAMKIVMMVHEGKVSTKEADLLFEQLWRV